MKILKYESAIKDGRTAIYQDRNGTMFYHNSWTNKMTTEWCFGDRKLYEIQDYIIVKSFAGYHPFYWIILNLMRTDYSKNRFYNLLHLLWRTQLAFNLIWFYKKFKMKRDSFYRYRILGLFRRISGLAK